MEWSCGRTFWGLEPQGRGGRGAGQLLPAVLVCRRAEDLFLCYITDSPTSCHPDSWFPCPEAGGNPRGLPDRGSLCPLETMTETIPPPVWTLPCTATPNSHFVMDLGGPQPGQSTESPLRHLHTLPSSKAQIVVAELCARAMWELLLPGAQLQLSQQDRCCPRPRGHEARVSIWAWGHGAFCAPAGTGRCGPAGRRGYVSPRHQHEPSLRPCWK